MEVDQHRLQGDLILLNAAITACEDQWPQALELLSRAEEQELETNEITYGSVPGYAKDMFFCFGGWYMFLGEEWNKRVPRSWNASFFQAEVLIFVIQSWGFCQTTNLLESDPESPTMINHPFSRLLHLLISTLQNTGAPLYQLFTSLIFSLSPSKFLWIMDFNNIYSL